LTIPSPLSGPDASSELGAAQAASTSENSPQKPRTYEVRTFGCQMNVHDSERMAGMLENAGYVPADGAQADVVVFNTCAVRENADNKLYGNLGMLAPVKAANPGMQIAVGGCLAQKDRETILKKAPWVDAVFGTHNVGALPALLERARHNHEAQLEILESLDVFPSTLPTKRDSVYSGWVSISVGCNNTCTFCIVPALRGKEKDRRPGDILAEIQALVDDGAIEVTLLGQNVNSYGVEFGDRQAFSKLLRACGEIEGLERVRFTSPHPAAFTDDVIDAMAETPNVMPQLHMPLQSGSDKVLRDMKRSYRSTKFLGILDKVREKIPHAAISTDIIVGFPGETEEDFQATLDVVEQSRFATAFTFQYSKRPGTPAADLPDQLPKAVVQERFERLTALQDRIAAEENRKQLGRKVEVMVTAQSGRKAGETHRLSGRSQDQRLVHFSVPDGAPAPRPGDLVTVTITEAAAFHLVADPTLRTTACAVPAPATPGTGPRRIPAAFPLRAAARARPGFPLACPRCLCAPADRWAPSLLSPSSVPPAQASQTLPSAWHSNWTAKSSTPMPCSSTAAWTSARRKSPCPNAGECGTISWTSWM
jgi:tRNA-2-methylthio-N6-dimethylallyladenosine synthase